MLLGILALCMAGLTLLTLIILYGIYVAFDGIFALVAAVLGGTVAPRWWLLIVGLISLHADVGNLRLVCDHAPNAPVLWL
jgi:uncharacterized membrane protein HdeD (DUF308 family)